MDFSALNAISKMISQDANLSEGFKELWEEAAERTEQELKTEIE